MTGPIALAGPGALVWLLGTDPELYRALDARPTAVVTNRGVVAAVSASAGALRYTRTLGFGVVGDESGDPRGIDPGEFIDVVFDRDLMLTAFSVGSWSEKFGDRGVVKLNGAEMAVIERTGFHAVDPFFIPAGWTLRFEGVSGAGRSERNGWTLTSFSTSKP